MRKTACFAAIAGAGALCGCAGSQTQAASPTPVVIVGSDVAKPDEPKAAVDPERAKILALMEAQEGSILGVLGAGAAKGGMWGDAIGDSFGAGGLGLSGIGEGVPGGVIGGSDGIGLGSIGTIGRGSGGYGYGGLALGASGSIQGDSGRYRVKARFETATVKGPLPAEVVARVANENLKDVEACYLLDVARGSTPRGRITLAISIDASGLVTEVLVPESTFWSSALPSCIAQSIGAWKFPAQGGEVKVILPVSL